MLPWRRLHRDPGLRAWDKTCEFAIGRKALGLTVGETITLHSDGIPLEYVAATKAVA